MKTVHRLLQCLTGLIFVVFGLNGFVQLIPVPELHPFMEMLHSSGYLFVIKGLEVLGGAVMFSRRLSMLGLFLLGPVVVNILLYHLFLDQRNAWAAVVVACLYVSVCLRHRRSLRAIWSVLTSDP